MYQLSSSNFQTVWEEFISPVTALNQKRVNLLLSLPPHGWASRPFTPGWRVFQGGSLAASNPDDPLKYHLDERKVTPQLNDKGSQRTSF